jgi:hypothetical protein
MTTLDRDAQSLIYSFVHTDKADNKLIIGQQQDVTPILEAAKQRRSHFDERARWKGDWHHVGYIPLVDYFTMLYAVDRDEDAFQKAIKIWANNSETCNYRSRPGRV